MNRSVNNKSRDCHLRYDALNREARDKGKYLLCLGTLSEGSGCRAEGGQSQDSFRGVDGGVIGVVVASVDSGDESEDWEEERLNRLHVDVER